MLEKLQKVHLKKGHEIEVRLVTDTGKNTNIGEETSLWRVEKRTKKKYLYRFIMISQRTSHRQSLVDGGRDNCLPNRSEAVPVLYKIVTVMNYKNGLFMQTLKIIPLF